MHHVEEENVEAEKQREIVKVEQEICAQKAAVAEGIQAQC